MLFSYQSFDYPIYDIQKALNTLFCEIWCDSNEKSFVEHVSEHKDVESFFECMKYPLEEQTHKEKSLYTKNGAKFISLASEIYIEFHKLSLQDRVNLKKAYIDSQDIEGCLLGRVTPLSKEDIQKKYPTIAHKLEELFLPLWDSSLLTGQLMKLHYGTKKGHYEEFDKNNRYGSCAYCGMDTFYTADDEGREAYDHFLPATKYYFSILNFQNLAPMCEKCNKGAKGQKDPLYSSKDGRRQKLFYPYAENHPDILINVAIDKKEIDSIRPQNIAIDFGPAGVAEELESWDDVFHVKRRFVNYMVRQYKTLLNNALIKSNYDPSKFMQSLNEMENTYSCAPFAEGNFLKIQCIHAYINATANFSSCGSESPLPV